MQCLCADFYLSCSYILRPPYQQSRCYRMCEICTVQRWPAAKLNKNETTNNVTGSRISAAKYYFCGHITRIYFIIGIKNATNKYIALEVIELLFFNQITIYFSLRGGGGCMLLCIATDSASPHFSLLRPFDVPYSMLSIQSAFVYTFCSIHSALIINCVPFIQRSSFIQYSASTVFNSISVQYSLYSIHSIFRINVSVIQCTVSLCA